MKRKKSAVLIDSDSDESDSGDDLEAVGCVSTPQKLERNEQSLTPNVYPFINHEKT